VCDPSNGTVTVDGLTGCVEYTPNLGYIGTDELCIIVCDEDGTCDTTIVPIDVIPTAPVTDTLDVVDVTEDTPTEICGDITMIPGETPSGYVCDPSNGTVTVDGLTGCVVYTPNTGYI